MFIFDFKKQGGILMNFKERVLATLNDKPVDKIPYIPRLDLWFYANKTRDTLPKKYKNATLIDIVDDLEVGYHAVVPNFRDFIDPLEIVDRALGIWRIDQIPYKTVINGVRRNINYEGDYTTVEYMTPYGNVKATTRYTKMHENSGITLSDIVEKVIKSEDDYEAVAYIFENIDIIPEFKRFEAFQGKIGNRGIHVACCNLAASPMIAIQRYLMDYNTFFINLMDNPDKLEWLADKIGMYYNKLFKVMASCPAKIIMLGSNYDSTITYPPFFKKYITPHLKKMANLLHEENKFLLTHTDGENDGLLEHYMDSDIDIADSVCPAPMTKLSLKEHRNVFQDKITIWGGVPSVTVLINSMSDRKFEEFLDDFFTNQIGKGDHLILSVSDSVPPDAKFERIVRIAELCDEFGPVK
jgi:uroporphyrinogen-III decarboxylase